MATGSSVHRLSVKELATMVGEEEQFWRGVAGSRDEAAPVQCLGLLYSQAALTAGPLIEHAATWASTVGGRLDPALPPPEVVDSMGLMEWIRLGAVKSPQRAVEKALLCYSGDVSRLLDLCRVRIYIPRVQDLAACVRIVTADTTVRVVRVKNWMRPRSSDNSEFTGGFRVSLGANLTIFCTSHSTN